MSTVTAIIHTQDYIRKYYQNNISADALLERYKKINFDAKEMYPLLSSMFAGVCSGILTAILWDVVSDASVVKVEKSLPMINRIMRVLPSVALICFVGLLIASLSLLSVNAIKHFRNNYNQFIAPYERKIIIEKLDEKYKFKSDI